MCHPKMTILEGGVGTGPWDFYWTRLWKRGDEGYVGVHVLVEVETETGRETRKKSEVVTRKKPKYEPKKKTCPNC